MLSNCETKDVEFLCFIVNLGYGSKVLKRAKHHGISEGTILLGRGTINNKILCYLGLSDIRKEIVYLVSYKEKINEVLDKLNVEFKLEKPNHGVAFTTPICSIGGISSCSCDCNNEERGAKNIMYHSITVIVEKGKAEDVIDAATKAGSTGGTIINGRGSGIHETSKVFAMEIEPEKEMVIIISKSDKTEDIVANIRKDLKIEEHGNGIILVQNINKAYGLYE